MKYTKLKFRIQFEIRTLVDIPVNNAVIFAQWKVVSKAKIKGLTKRAATSGHRVVWNEQFDPFDVVLQTDSGLLLQPNVLKVKVLQEKDGGHSQTKVGVVSINLSEFAGSSHPLTRRYLLQECKSNTALEVTLHLTQLSGPPTFKVPASAQHQLQQQQLQQQQQQQLLLQQKQQQKKRGSATSGDQLDGVGRSALDAAVLTSHAAAVGADAAATAAAAAAAAAGGGSGGGGVGAGGVRVDRATIGAVGGSSATADLLDDDDVDLPAGLLPPSADQGISGGGAGAGGLYFDDIPSEQHIVSQALTLRNDDDLCVAMKATRAVASEVILNVIAEDAS